MPLIGGWHGGEAKGEAAAPVALVVAVAAGAAHPQALDGLDASAVEGSTCGSILFGSC